MTSDTQKDWSEEIGAPAYDSIREMVAALNCDYERLEELREERDDWEPANSREKRQGWAKCHPDEAEQLLELEEAAGECTSREEAEQRIQEDALSCQVRSGWEDTATEFTAAEFCLLLTTGGPAVRIIGELDGGEPTRARLQVQDWFKPWTDYIPADQDVLLAYARCFFFGE